MDFLIKMAALTAACSMGLTSIAFFYLSNLIPKKSSLKWWAFSFTAITLQYIMVFFFPFDKFGIFSPLWGAVDLTFVSGLLIGVFSFLNRKIPFAAIGVLWCIIVLWSIFSVIVKLSFFYQTIPITIIVSGMVFYAGFILFSYKSVYQKSGHLFAGVAFILWGVNRLNFSFIEFMPWLIPYSYIITLLAAMAMGTGLIIAVLERKYFHAVINDITVSRQDENALRESEEKFRRIFDNLQDGYFWADRDGNILLANQFAADILGYDLKELMRKNMAQDIYFDPEDRETVKKIMFQNGKIENYELTFKKKDGQTIIVEANSHIVYNGNQQRSMEGTFRDITLRKQAEKDQANLEKQLRQAQKMESVGRLAGGIAHDFNNILFPILGHSEMLLQDVHEDSSFKHSLNQIHKSALRASELVKQILTFSRHKDGELKLIKMQPIIKEALKLIRSTIPTTINIKQDLQSDCGLVKADPTQIHQIIMNLATNAYHAMEEIGGELKIRLKKIVFETPDLLDPGIKPGAYALLSISDTGKGMDNELIEKIFDPFFTTKEPGKGTGMGLSVVHGIVKNMHGAVKVNSKLGKGTEFHVYMPLAEAGKKQHVTHTTTFLKKGTEHILLVDDEKAIIEMEQNMLQRLGYKVTSFLSSLEALETFCKTPYEFDLVITDMQMPHMAGDKLSLELSKIRSKIPILLCTGFSETISEEKAKTLGINGFLLKPIIMKDLSQKIREVLDKNHAL